MKMKDALLNMLLRVMPETIHDKLASDYKSLFASRMAFTLKSLGTFAPNVIASAVNVAAKEGGEKQALSREGATFRLTSTSDGVRIKAENSDDAHYLVELNLLTPDLEARVSAFDRVTGQCLPSLPQGEKWRAIITERPLTEMELVSLISMVRNAPNQFEGAIWQKLTDRAEIQLDDLIPTSKDYYEVLLGSAPDGESVETWLKDTLRPHVRLLLSSNLNTGLRYALALNVDPAVSLAEITADIPSFELLAAMQGLADLRSPFAVLGLIEIATARIAEDGFPALLDSLLARNLVGGASEPNEKVWVVLPSLITSSLGGISIAKEMFDLPSYWRRFAAIAHSSLLCEIFSEEFIETNQFVEWLGTIRSPLQLYAEILDMQGSPRWKARDLSVRGFKALLTRRLLQLTTDLQADESIMASIKRIGSVENDFVTDGSILYALLPSFLVDDSDEFVLKYSATDESSILRESFSHAILQLKADPSCNSWGLFMIFSKIAQFDDKLLIDLECVTASFAFAADRQHIESTFNALAAAAEVSAAQRCVSLSNSIAAFVLNNAKELTNELDIRAGFIVIVLASCSVSEYNAWKAWLSEKLVAYAAMLPKGNPCKRLLSEIHDLESLIRIDDRFLGWARMMASSAIR